MAILNNCELETPVHTRSRLSQRADASISNDADIIVDWDGPNDPAKPANWSFARKWAIVVTTSLATFIVSFASSVFSAAISQIQAKFRASSDVALLCIALYVLGFAFGPMVWGPASELYGKTRPLWLGYLMFCIFQIPCAVAMDLPTLLVFRFLAGLAGSSALAILGGMYVDFLLEPTERGISTAVFSLATFCGPVAGPIIGNVSTVRLGWRWITWITLIGAAFFGVVAFLTTPETSQAVILRWKAQKLRKAMMDDNICTQGEGKKLGAAVFVQKYLTKPIRMFAREPIRIFFTIYMSLAYGIIYVTFTMYPLAFVRDRGWSPIDGSLPFLSILLGVVFACAFLAIHNIFYISRRFRETQNHVPVRRLPPMILGSIILPGGIFWFAWTSDPGVSWVPQVLAGVLIGCGSVMVFMTGVVYLIEVYLSHANSALAINNFVCSAFAASFPFFAADLLKDVGIKVGGSALGGICVGLVPFPLIFWRFGHKISSWSKFAGY